MKLENYNIEACLIMTMTSTGFILFFSWDIVVLHHISIKDQLQLQWVWCMCRSLLRVLVVLIDQWFACLVDDWKVLVMTGLQRTISSMLTFTSVCWNLSKGTWLYLVHGGGVAVLVDGGPGTIRVRLCGQRSGVFSFETFSPRLDLSLEINKQYLH